MSTTTWNISTFSLSAFLLGSPFRLHRDAPPAAAVLMFWKCTFQHAFSGSICQTAAKPSFNQNDIIVLLRRPSKIVIKCLVEPWSCNPPAGTRFCVNVVASLVIVLRVRENCLERGFKNKESCWSPPLGLHDQVRRNFPEFNEFVGTISWFSGSLV